MSVPGQLLHWKRVGGSDLPHRLRRVHRPADGASPEDQSGAAIGQQRVAAPSRNDRPLGPRLTDAPRPLNKTRSFCVNVHATIYVLRGARPAFVMPNEQKRGYILTADQSDA
eukprot:1176785-Prorocentrum_minimum.AAC.2